jgi:N-acetylglucosaminyldiphosphoundecaprenol N-acetyl-beta-D-mannosaminyltransferase
MTRALQQQEGPERELFGLRVAAITLDETVARCVAAATSDDDMLEVGVINAAKVVKMGRDAELRAAVSGCDLIVADGQSVVWASRLLRAPLPERVAGIDLFQRLLAEAERTGLGVYLLGARAEVLAEMIRRIETWYPKLRIAGSRDGYFGDDEAATVADEIKATGADLLFLGMTSPKKEKFVATYGKRSGAKVVHGVGGSFDVLAGVVRRAPRVWQKVGMEWLYRALQEPGRLGRRYLSTNAAFVRLTAREMIRSRRRPRTVTNR